MSLNSDSCCNRSEFVCEFVSDGVREESKHRTKHQTSEAKNKHAVRSLQRFSNFSPAGETSAPKVLSRLCPNQIWDVMATCALMNCPFGVFVVKEALWVVMPSRTPSFIRGSLSSASPDGTDVGRASPPANHLNVAQRLISPLGSPQFLFDAVFI